jgi:hypothetical protein
MGNGTTFPIESIIFFALAQEATAMSGGSISDVRVYGDDIVCEPRASLLLIEGLRFLGFRTNTDKTYLFGAFRECCGVDIFKGVDIRPVYLRKIPKLPDEVASLYNRLASHRYGFAFRSTLRYLISLVDKPLYGPSFLGSGQRLFVSPKGIQQSVGEWYAGKAQLPDAYFFGDPPAKRGRSKWWHSSFAVLDVWTRGRVRIAREARHDECYLAFLYGLGERIYRPTKRLMLTTFTHSGVWPEWTPHKAIYDAIADHDSSGLAGALRSVDGM